jgi:hypothetical protein
MSTISDQRLQQLAGRLAELEARLASGTLEGDAFVAASRDYAELEPVARAASEALAMRAAMGSWGAPGWFGSGGWARCQFGWIRRMRWASCATYSRRWRAVKATLAVRPWPTTPWHGWRSIRPVGRVMLGGAHRRGGGQQIGRLGEAGAWDSLGGKANDRESRLDPPARARGSEGLVLAAEIASYTVGTAWT